MLYPAPNGDHSALARLLAGLTDARFPPAADLPARAAPPPPPPEASSRIPVRWVPGPERVEHFTGRAEELARLDRWAADPQVALVGVTAWGGAGKTALVTHWVQGADGAAERHVTEAITIAAPRGLVPAHSAALAARARIRAAQAGATADLNRLFQGRDAADAALRLAVRHQLAWHELDALRAHALLDQAEGINRGWAAKADALHARLVPPGLDPDPLATVERLVARPNQESED